MVQSIDFNRPVYNGVNINIKKPEVYTGEQTDKITNPIEDNGIYNGVNIDVDNPRVGTKPIYDYPEADGIVTYDMLNFNPIPIDAKYDKIEPSNEEVSEEENTDEKVVENEKEVEVPAPNYTTVEAEKSNANEYVPSVSGDNTTTTALSFRANEQNIKKPEIVPPEPILPKVDIALVTKNLESTDKDVQAEQLEEIVRTAVLDPENGKNYLVSDVFTSLINIVGEDATKLAAPTKQQIEARQKLMANIMAVDKNPKAIDNLPYKMSDDEINIAMALSPMELTERNKEYAVTALGALAELFIEDYQKKEGHVVPITDAPGVSAIVNVLRRDPDAGIKLAAIDALRHIKRPEYKEELSALFTLAQTDPNPAVSQLSAKALAELN